MITTTSADGTNVVAVDEGQGPVILVLHPGMDDGRSWGKVAARLAPRFRAQEVDDVLAVAKVIGEPMLVVGHSSGGVVALEAMVASPSTFPGAVSYEPPVVIDPPMGGEALQRARAAMAAGKAGKARIEVPTVLLGGDRSPAHLGKRLDALARALPRAEKVVLRGQGHGANQRAPGEVARIIETLADKVLR